MSNGDSSLALQTAIYTALAANTTISSLGASVYDGAPQEQAFPYIQIGDDTAVDWNTQDHEGMNLTLTIHSWTQRDQGRKGVKTLMAAVYAALNKQSLSLSGHVLVDIRQEFAKTELDPDGFTYHGVQRFRAFTQGV